MGGQLFSNIADLCHILCWKCGTWCANKKWKPDDMRHRRLKGFKLDIFLYPRLFLNHFSAL